MAEIGTALVRQTVDRLNKRLVRFQPVIGMEEINVQSRPMSYIDFLVPGILSLMIMNNNLNGVAGTIASWRERGILRRMQGTPLSSGDVHRRANYRPHHPERSAGDRRPPGGLLRL